MWPAAQAVEKVHRTFSTAFTMPRFSARAAGRKAAAARRKRLLTQAFCRHSIQHEGAPGHRCGFAIPGPFWAANRAASSKPARFFRRWRRFASFPLVLPLQKRTLFLQTGFFDKLRCANRFGLHIFLYIQKTAPRPGSGYVCCYRRYQGVSPSAVSSDGVYCRNTGSSRKDTARASRAGVSSIRP